MTLSSTRNEIPYPEQTDTQDTVAKFLTMAAQADLTYMLRFQTTSARDAAIPTPTVGMVAYILVDDALTIATTTSPSGWVRYEVPRVQTRTSSSVQTSDSFDDPTLGMSVAANAVYHYRFILSFSGTVASTLVGGHFWKVPTGATIKRMGISGGNAAASDTSAVMDYIIREDPSLQRTLPGTSGSGAPAHIQENGVLRTSSTAGSFIPSYVKGAPHSSLTLWYGAQLMMVRIS